mmetsp:Transcript_69067/g.162504  ORF Transcript_69067/g.162504 Transcript_69067/m.162504 type:complete len:184 (+) Transcript_69067:3-554(+)
MAREEPVLRLWMCPFVMAPCNIAIVRRSAAVCQPPYTAVRYNEAMGVPYWPLALLVSSFVLVGTPILAVLLRVPLLGKCIWKLAPAPGTGPSEKVQRESEFTVQLVARRKADPKPVARVTLIGHGDPGYQETSKMVSEAALCMADPETERKLPPASGFLTPASAFGMALVDRMRNVGFTFRTG